MIAPPTMTFKAFSSKEFHIIRKVAEIILGVPQEELGTNFEQEVDEYVFMLPDYMKKDLHLLLKMFNLRIFVFMFLGKIKPFTGLSTEQRNKFLQKWQQSRIPLMRTGFAGLKSIVGFGYYSQDKALKEMNFPGTTIGREHLTPTLLFGKQPWSSDK